MPLKVNAFDLFALLKSCMLFLLCDKFTSYAHNTVLKN